MALFLGLMNFRQETFASGVARGLSAAAAYAEAYAAKPSVAETNGPRLLRSAQMQERIAEIRADNAAARNITLPVLTGMMLTVYHKSIGWGQGSAAQQAAAGIAKMHGFMVDKQQLEVSVRRPSASPDSPDEMPEADWLDKYSNVIEGSAVLESPSNANTMGQGSDTVDIQQSPSSEPVENPDSNSEVEPKVSAVDVFGHDL